MFTASEIANLADMFRANYAPDGNYRGNSTFSDTQPKTMSGQFVQRGVSQYSNARNQGVGGP